MSHSLFQLIALGFFAALGNLLGALPLVSPRFRADYRPAVKYFLALGAGFMLAVTLFEVLPKTISLWQTSVGGTESHSLHIPMLLLLGGYLVTQFFEHTLAPHFHLGADAAHTDHHVISTRSAYSGMGALGIHTFFDGVSIAAAAMIDFRVGLLVFIAVFLHKFPEGLTVASLMAAAGKSTRTTLLVAGLIGLATPLGVLSFYLLGSSIEGAVAYALPFAAGVTLYVAASDLIPEVNHHGGGRPLVSLSVFAGVALFFLVHVGLEQILPE